MSLVSDLLKLLSKVGKCDSQLAWLFHMLSSLKLVQWYICKTLKTIRESDIWRKRQRL